MAVPTPEAWRRAKDIEFTIGKEGWGIYELEENAEIRARVVLLKLLKISIEGIPEPQYAPSSVALVSVNAPPKIRGKPPSHPATPDEVQTAEKVEVQFRTLEEPWNEYLFDDSGPKMIKLKLVVSAVQKAVGMYDNMGLPVYQVSHGTVVAPPVPRKISSGR
ncbi:MAG: hypothetical protein WA688_01625 [Thermoplasmata archaeon]